jgi:hypothetical protein
MGRAGSVQLPPITGTRKKLIEQAVDAARGAPPPADLQLAWQCKRWNALPDAGGINDQYYATLRSMAILSNIYETIEYMRRLKGNQIHSLTDSQRKLIRWVMDQGIRVT